MPDNTPRLYEVLVLISQNLVSTGIGEAINTFQGMLDRAEAETLALRKYDDLKLAYPIAGQKRGTYLIGYFKSKPSQIVNIERDCNLSEDILRVMFTRCDHFGETELEAALTDTPREHEDDGEGTGAGAGAGAGAAAEPAEAASPS